jgi:membrane dipeptidase
VIVDAHLDLAWNALYNERDLTLPVEQIRAAEADPATVAMTSLRSFGDAGVGLVFATLYAEPRELWTDAIPEQRMPRRPDKYETPEEAEAIALEMLALYERWETGGHARIIRDRTGLERHLERFAEDRVPGLLILVEGADVIVSPADLPRWFERGVRMIGLAWGSTRYAGGTGSSAPLTELGRELLTGMAELGIVHDASHLSEEAFWEAAGLPHHALCVTHAAARALMLPPPGHRLLVPLNRFLTDEQIAEAARPRGAASRGVVGLAMLNAFLEPRWSFAADGRANGVTVDRQVTAHLHRIADAAGWESVGIGSDQDAAFGRDEAPAELDTVADWERIADHVPDEARAGVLGGNWLRFLRETLP